MTILDVAIVNVAIPSIQRNLHIAESTVQWVITAYAITFGGFLLLGGRMADLLGHRRFDATGAVSVTASLTILVYAISKAPFVGWATFRTIGLLVLSAAFLAAFLVTETRTRAPLTPFEIFRNRSVTAANIVSVLFGAAIFANFFILTLYVQQVLHWSA